MTNATIIINHTKRAIEISKAFSKQASIYNSTAYNELKAAKNDFPTYRVQVKSAPKRTLEEKITLSAILYYVEKHSGKDSKEWKELEDLRGKSTEELKKELGEGYIFETREAASFFQIKKWFFKTYSELTKKEELRKNHINAIIAGAA